MGEIIAIAVALIIYLVFAKYINYMIDNAYKKLYNI